MLCEQRVYVRVRRHAVLHLEPALLQAADLPAERPAGGRGHRGDPQSAVRHADQLGDRAAQPAAHHHLQRAHLHRQQLPHPQSLQSPVYSSLVARSPRSSPASPLRIPQRDRAVSARHPAAASHLPALPSLPQLARKRAQTGHRRGHRSSLRHSPHQLRFLRRIGASSLGQLPRKPVQRQYEHRSELAVHAERVSGHGDASRVLLHEHPSAQRDLSATAPRVERRRADSLRSVLQERERLELRELPDPLELRFVRCDGSAKPQRRICAVFADGRIAFAAIARRIAAISRAAQVQTLSFPVHSLIRSRTALAQAHAADSAAGHGARSRPGVSAASRGAAVPSQRVDFAVVQPGYPHVVRAVLSDGRLSLSSVTLRSSRSISDRSPVRRTSLKWFCSCRSICTRFSCGSPHLRNSCLWC